MLSAFIKKSLMPKGSFIWGNAMFGSYGLAFRYKPVKNSTQIAKCGFSFSPDPVLFSLRLIHPGKRKRFPSHAADELKGCW